MSRFEAIYRFVTLILKLIIIIMHIIVIILVIILIKHIYDRIQLLFHRNTNFILIMAETLLNPSLILSPTHLNIYCNYNLI